MYVKALLRVPALALIGLICGTAVAAQNPVHNHIGHAATGFNGTPEGQGLLSTAIAEAAVAARHAGLAARDPSDLDGAKRHMGHVIHALDPSVVESGPGLGYGVKQGAEGAARHVELAAGTDGASQNVTTHSNHVITAARNAAANVDAAIALAQRIQASNDYVLAEPLIEQLAALTEAIASGTDANDDGRVGWQAPEGGLAQSDQHLTLLQRGEGLIN